MGFFQRLGALTYKEFLQLIRDRSSILLGGVLPLILILLIGYGVSLDIKNVPIAVVRQDASPTAIRTLNFLEGSPYFSPRDVGSMQEAEALMRRDAVKAIVVVPADFTKRLAAGDAVLQLILSGTETSTAMLLEGYMDSCITGWNAANPSKISMKKGRAVLENRIWFNDENSSTWYIVPGLMMLIMTIVGIFLTALVMAREWECGTLESLFVTPMQLMELLLSKMIPYFFVAFFGMLLCLLMAHKLFYVPIHGSMAVLLLISVIYLFIMLGIGLAISSATKSQFLACQISLVAGLMPSMMLTGFLYDLRSVPRAVSIIGHLLPQTYYLELLKSLMLSGNYWPLIWKNGGILLLYAALFLGLAWKVTRKRVE